MEEHVLKTDTYSCTSCGADLKYKPGTASLHCNYCGAENEIPIVEKPIEELDFYESLNQEHKDEATFTETFIKCESCGATSSIDPKIVSAFCPYCSNPLILDQAKSESIIQPKSLLPFKLTKEEAQNEFKKWINKLWFAPNLLKKATLHFDHFKGVYIPYWTYDTDTTSQYTGQRGTYYYVNENYTTTENGKTVTKTREVRKIRWRNVSGMVQSFFDDILVVASNSLPEKFIYKLEPWDLQNLLPFEKKFLSGFITEKYQIDLKKGFNVAKKIAEKEIRVLVKRDIGGDEQRINYLTTQYNNITYKHLLLPVFISAFNFKGKLFQFLVNGRTGEVQGQRPYSWIKITLTVLISLAVITSIYLLIGSK